MALANFGGPSPKNEIVMDLSHELLVNTPAPLKIYSFFTNIIFVQMLPKVW